MRLPIRVKILRRRDVGWCVIHGRFLLLCISFLGGIGGGQIATFVAVRAKFCSKVNINIQLMKQDKMSE